MLLVKANRAILFLYLLLIPVITRGEYMYSLRDILSIARKNATGIQVIQYQARAERAQTDIYKSEAFPVVSFQSGSSYMSQSLRGQGIQESFLFLIIDRINGYVFDWALSVQQPLITFGRVSSALRLAGVSDSLTDANQRYQEDIFYLRVIELFTRAYTAQLDLQIAQDALQRSERIYERSELDYRADRISQRDFYRIEAQLRGDQANLITARSDRTITRSRLNTTIGLGEEDVYSLVLDTGRTVFDTPDTILQNTQIFLKKLQADIYRHQQKGIRSGLFPSISLSGSITNQFMIIDTSGLTELYLEYLDRNGGDTGEMALGIPDIPSPLDYFNPGYFNYLIGLQLTWNIFDGKRIFAQLRQARLNEDIARAELQQLEESTRTDREELRMKLSALDSSISAVQLRFNAAEKALSRAEEDIERGFIDAILFLEIQQEFQATVRQLDSLRLQQLLLRARLRILHGLPVYAR